ncbi:MAG TPA: glycosyltransferase family 2 protein [Thermoanaerobaculia bacterium]|jgi:GT2 family glycosyltransferase|nr:glycosyltransferase family 2 protein [Thermoanaerobaculia bacterium]
MIARGNVVAVIEFSVVIPTFNTAQMTLRCCRAVLASLPRDTEVIVADDGSTDGTAERLAREAPAVRVVRLDSNRGFAPAANRGVAASSGRIILLLNSDAIIDADALAAFLGAFAADAKLGVAGARLLNPDRTPQWSGGAAPTLAWMIGVVSGAGHLARLVRRRDVRVQRDVDWVSGAAMTFRREVWDAAGPLDERFRFYCQDIEFCLRARDAGWRVAVIEEARVVHEIGGTIVADRALRHDPSRLWPDLIVWGGSRHGRRWMFIARIVLTLTALVRIAGQAICGHDNAAFIRAMKAIRRT